MSCYDTVNFTCPECSQGLSTHSKAGRCDLLELEAASAPLIIAADLDGDELSCPHCATEFVIVALAPRRVRLLLSRVQDDE